MNDMPNLSQPNLISNHTSNNIEIMSTDRTAEFQIRILFG